MKAGGAKRKKIAPSVSMIYEIPVRAPEALESIVSCEIRCVSAAAVVLYRSRIFMARNEGNCDVFSKNCFSRSYYFGILFSVELDWIDDGLMNHTVQQVQSSGHSILWHAKNGVYPREPLQELRCLLF